MVDDLDRKLRALARATDGIRPTDALTGTVVDGLEQDDPLSLLASATDGLSLGDDFSDAVMARVAGQEAKLAEASTGEASDDALLRLAQATSDLRPADDFTDVVLAAIADEPAQSRVPASQLMTSFADGVTRSARSGLVFAAVAAAACVLLSWYTQQDFDTQLMLQADNAMVEEAE